MKFSTDYFYGDERLDEIERLWKQTAMKLSMEHGVDIKIKLTMNDGLYSCTGIEFVIGDKSFSSLKELRKALKLKAFL